MKEYKKIGYEIARISLERIKEHKKLYKKALIHIVHKLELKVEAK